MRYVIIRDTAEVVSWRDWK